MLPTLRFYLMMKVSQWQHNWHLHIDVQWCFTLLDIIFITLLLLLLCYDVLFASTGTSDTDLFSFSSSFRLEWKHKLFKSLQWPDSLTNLSHGKADWNGCQPALINYSGGKGVREQLERGSLTAWHGRHLFAWWKAGFSDPLLSPTRPGLRPAAQTRHQWPSAQYGYKSMEVAQTAKPVGSWSLSIRLKHRLVLFFLLMDVIGTRKAALAQSRFTIRSHLSCIIPCDMQMPFLHQTGYVLLKL